MQELLYLINTNDCVTVKISPKIKSCHINERTMRQASLKFTAVRCPVSAVIRCRSINILFISGKIPDATIPTPCSSRSSVCLVQTGAYWCVTACTADAEQPAVPFALSGSSGGPDEYQPPNDNSDIRSASCRRGLVRLSSVQTRLHVHGLGRQAPARGLTAVATRGTEEMPLSSCRTQTDFLLLLGSPSVNRKEWNAPTGCGEAGT